MLGAPIEHGVTFREVGDKLGKGKASGKSKGAHRVRPSRLARRAFLDCWSEHGWQAGKRCRLASKQMSTSCDHRASAT